MAHQRSDEPPRNARAEREETVDPKNPPNSVINPTARTAALGASLGVITVVFAAVGVALVYWMLTRPPADRPEESPNTSAVGTAGAQLPGGGSRRPEFSRTRDELEYRGAGERPQGPTPGLATAEPLTTLSAISREPARNLVGRRVELGDVEVESVSGDMFTITDGSSRATVLRPNGATVHARQRASVHGVVEQAAESGIYIKATRVDVKE